jgi:hypothetical protein
MHQICTIVATNYIPQALAFLESVREFHPKIPCTVLVTDGSSVKHDFGPHTRFITSSEIGVDPARISKMETYYDQVEFATSLKPYLLRTLLSSGSKSVTFLDPDTQLYGNIDDIFELSEGYDAILTPHRLTPLKSNSDFYSETTFLKYGIFNLGFITVGQNSFPLLEWWCKRLEFDSTRYLNDSIFTDQKWANQFPAYFNCHIYKLPDLNLAPWNLDERNLHLIDGRLYVGNIPLRMIHFSQMSSLLAKGIGTNLWESTIDGTRKEIELVALINSVTSIYGSKLQAFSSFDNHVAIVKKPLQPNYSSFYRNSVRKREKRNQQPLMRSNRIALWFLTKIKFLDRSETFVALVRYLPRDLAKVRVYLSFPMKVRKIRRDEMITGGIRFLRKTYR